jgi:hypothetical protein
MKYIFVDFNAKVGTKDIFKPTTGNVSSHEISNDNVVRRKLVDISETRRQN